MKNNTNWERRLTPSQTYQRQRPNGVEYDLEFHSSTGEEYSLRVLIDAEFEPAQRGGWTDPSWDAYYYGAVAWWYREGRGWKELALTSSQEDSISEFLIKRSAE